tara:strand:+ start:131 stop:493 length:363 start_codon:yes stop_codon:yes gene_type:complete
MFMKTTTKPEFSQPRLLGKRAILIQQFTCFIQKAGNQTILVPAIWYKGIYSNCPLIAALLAGNRNTNGTFNNRGTNGNWWSSSETSATNAQNRNLNSSQAGVNRNSNNKANGFSVRCLKD